MLTLKTLQSILNASTAGLVLTDRQGSIVLANRLVANWLNCEPPACIGLQIASLFEDDANLAARLVNTPHSNFNSHLITANGLMPVAVELERLDNEEDRPLLLLTIVPLATHPNPPADTDFRYLLESTPDTILVYNANGVLYANQQAVRTFGVASPQDIVGQPVLDLIHPDYHLIALRRLQNVLEKNEVALRQLKLLRADGSTRLVEVNSRLITFQNQPASLTIFRDTSTRFKTEKERNRQTEYFNAINETLMALLNRHESIELLQVICSRAADMVGTPDGFIDLLEPDGMEMITRIGIGTEVNAIGTRIKATEGITGRVWQTGEPLVVHDYRNWLHRLPGDHFDGIHAVAALPLKTGDQVIGVLGLLQRTPNNYFEYNTMELLTRFAQLASVVLDNANLFSTTRRRLSELNTIQRVGQATNSSLQLKDVFRTVVEQLNVAFGYQMVSAYLSDGQGVALQHYIGYDEVIYYIPNGQGVTGRVANSGQAIFVQDTAGEPDFLYANETVNQSIIVPLKSGKGEVLGILAVESNGNPKLTIDDFHILTTLADQVSIAMVNARLFVELSASEERYRSVISELTEGVITSDISGNITLLNRVAEELTGWRQAEAQGEPLSKVFSLLEETSRRPTETTLSKVLRSNVAIETRQHYLLVTRTGQERPITYSIAPLRQQDNHLSGAVLVFRDVTKERQLQEEMLKSSKIESLGLLAGGIAHDFNNLLTAVLGNLSMIKNDLHPYADNLSEAYHSAVEAEKATLQAKELTAQLLTFARGGAPVKKTARLQEVIQESVIFTQRGSNVHTEIDLPLDLYSIEVDGSQLSQVIQNLVINALQAMPNGGKLQVIGRNQLISSDSPMPLTPGNYVQITIQDTGSGISAENLSRIFDPYFTTKETGSGLGLAVAYSVIKRHEGYISVESRLGQGTRFLIYLPASDKVPVLASQRKNLNLKIKRSGKVLIMDDEESIQYLVSRLLRRIGYEVVIASEGQEALEHYKSAYLDGKPFDVVIMDLTIPGGQGGKETIRKLLEFDPYAKAIVSSGYNTDPVMANYTEYGFCAVLGKPYRLEELVGLMEDIIEEAPGII